LNEAEGRGPILTFRLPDVSGADAEGFVVHWLKREGEAVRAGEDLLEVQFEKVAVAVPAPAGGTLRRIHVPAGEPVRAGAPLCDIEGILGAAGDAGAGPVGDKGGTGLPVPQPSAAEAGILRPADPAAAPAPSAMSRPVASPAARRLARELGVDIGGVRGTGPAGRITEADVRLAAAGPREAQADQPARPSPLAGVAGHWEPLAPEQRVLARRLAQGLREAIPYTVCRRVDATALVERRQTLRSRGSGVNLTDLLHRAVVLALADFPSLQAVWQGDALFVPEETNLAFAVAQGPSLFAPVIFRADRLDLEGLARERRRLTSAVERHALTDAELAGGTFTVSNLGPYDIDAFTPVLDPPQPAILGVGRVDGAVIWHDGRPEPRRTTVLALTLDHRVANGATAARFLARLAELLEAPQAWVAAG
jgi:pyruvate dehydrogenase E2 component (dihydrolipoamide acetyltransferase)